MRNPDLYKCSKCGVDATHAHIRAECAGCGTTVWLCGVCWPMFVACSDKCRDEWRQMAKTMWNNPPPLTGR